MIERSRPWFPLWLGYLVLTAGLMSTGTAFAQEVNPPVTPETTAAPPAAEEKKEEAAPAPIVLDSGKIAWMLTSSALVLMMTAPGLALFYGGLVRKKNILGVMMQCIFLMGAMSVLWAIVGYSWAFGGKDPYIGSFDHVMLKGVIAHDGPTPETSRSLAQAVADGTSTGMIFCLFQGMFFIITPGLICGAFAERMKFSTMCVFSLLWGLLVYCPIAHWVWSGPGWLNVLNYDAKFPAYDLAGGTVVHISSGISALICALVLGKRIGFGKEPMPPHNLTYTYIGATMLWVGWFGFNGGSALFADQWAVNAFFATHLAAAAGVIGWAGAEWVMHGRPTTLGACSGCVAGLVCVTPASGAVNPIHGIYLGLAAGIVCYLACSKVKNAFGYDDTLDAFGVHGVGGTLGALLTGVFATNSVVRDLVITNGTATKAAPVGLIEGNAGQLINQAVGVGASMLLAIVGTFILLKILEVTMGLRVTPEQEVQGLDITQHNEEGYIMM